MGMILFISILISSTNKIYLNNKKPSCNHNENVCHRKLANACQNLRIKSQFQSLKIRMKTDRIGRKQVMYCLN